MSINILKQTSYNNTSAYNGRPIEYIVIHYTAGTTSRSGTAYNTAVMFSNPSICASADFIVDDSQIVQFNPDIENYYCWHCGDSKNYTKGGSFYGKCRNNNSIGIEVCSSNSTGTMTAANDSSYYFTNAVVENAVKLTQHLMKLYNIPAERIIRHYDVSGKLCPGIVGWNEDSGNVTAWQSFKSRLIGSEITSAFADHFYRVRKSWNDAKSQIGAYKNLDGAKKAADANKGYSVFDYKGTLVYPKTNSTSFKPYTVKITADILNVRQGAGTNYPVVTTVKQNEVYTIVEEKNGWGLLKAYQKGKNGWISLNYAVKK